MQAHDIVVIGTSSGGVDALKRIVAELPADLPAAVFVVLHLLPRSTSLLPKILSRAGPLPAVHPTDGARIAPGFIYVAPPDLHLVVEGDCIHLSRGPKEQHHRPCINVTFRSAAMAYGDRVCGVLLTGELDDGTAGLWEIKRRGGVAVVQNPEEASSPSMPLSALREVEADYIVGLDRIGPLLVRLACGTAGRRTEIESSAMEPKLTDLTCPDCGGTIWETPRGNGAEFRCRVGHTFSPGTMLAEHFAVQERALYSAIVTMEEGASLVNRLAGHFEEETAARLRAEAGQRLAEAEQLRKLVREHRAFTLE